ncbi:MAG TPA: replicative DNA helicase [Candidatus Cloacimonas acidaminovorans]|jgi:replicative DNA helicase|uniref:Replicative DNA helicase n=1 Tax=Cloacimonas acidaminovorans (strain Evry) TaxID=459349 RepID=B0VHY1_CLOAI|nr:replicative DNA helicase [Candidatus Cloacimonas acidaminovorans]MBP8705205.1 replicative DNA helicase [Candidatus Cloacimonas sp.]OQC72643.1 MAG: Replicative DNA helicase [Candidatus Cloacimonetes bacterium ADurb.Bin003]MDD3605860.1 replicative DNA helicase [Candidatus Cloacimonas acidaminovorans]CAO80952.1 replicative DNA helicase [Candidatus Cloacimonas acidaminovorans str. Evry]HNZ88353.1 replicative DNA helicase [Candidatus Cloacimonas acidaminovorans]
MAKLSEADKLNKAQTERALPADINAEAALLSAMLIDSDVVSKGIEKIKEEYFYRNAHKLIFRTMQELFFEGIEIDQLTLINRLERNNLLEKVGGIPYINEIADFVVSSANFDYHLNIVTDQALLRHLILASNGIIENCYTAAKPVKTIVDEAEQAIFAIAELPSHQGFVRFDQVSQEVLDNIDKIASTKIPVTGVSSGFADLDRFTGGFRPGQFIIIAARPAMGKTSLALNIAANAAVNLNKKVAIFSMEMAADEVIMRMFSSASEVRMDGMLRGYGMNEEKLIRIMQASEVLSAKHIYIDDSGTNTPLDIRAKTRRLAAEIGGLDLVLIDYLQLMTLTREKDNRQQEISEISRALKILAKDMKIPVVALSQLNRAAESREDKRPKLADLRESGAIEQDADLVMFIYRDEYYYPETTQKPGIAEIIISKNRHGATGNLELGFEKEFTLFRPLETKYEQ